MDQHLSATLDKGYLSNHSQGLVPILTVGDLLHFGLLIDLTDADPYEPPIITVECDRLPVCIDYVLVGPYPESFREFTVSRIIHTSSEPCHFSK